MNLVSQINNTRRLFVLIDMEKHHNREPIRMSNGSVIHMQGTSTVRISVRVDAGTFYDIQREAEAYGTVAFTPDDYYGLINLKQIKLIDIRLVSDIKQVEDDEIECCITCRNLEAKFNEFDITHEC